MGGRGDAAPQLPEPPREPPKGARRMKLHAAKVALGKGGQEFEAGEGEGFWEGF